MGVSSIASTVTEQAAMQPLLPVLPVLVTLVAMTTAQPAAPCCSPNRWHAEIFDLQPDKDFGKYFSLYAVDQAAQKEVIITMDRATGQTMQHSVSDYLNKSVYTVTFWDPANIKCEKTAPVHDFYYTCGQNATIAMSADGACLPVL